jgi:hypothetical protein
MNRFEDRARHPVRRSPIRGGPLSLLSPLLTLPLTLLLTLLLASACAAPPDKYSAADIEQAASAGTLEGLFDSIQTDLADPGLKDAQRRTMELRLAEAGRSLAQGAEKSVQDAASQAALPSGLVPLSVYEAQNPLLEKLERWDAAVYQRVSSDLSTGRQKTQAAVAAAEKELGALGPKQDDRKLALYQELGALYGPGSEQQKSYAAKSEAALAELRTAANQAIASEDYTDAQRMLSIVAAVDPKDAAVEGTLVEVDAKLFEQRFYEALEKDRPDDAYKALVTLSEAANFDKVRPRLVESGAVMADYCVKLGAGATAAGNWSNAFRWFSQSRDIRERLGLAQPGAIPEEAPFISEMYRRYQKANGKELYGLAWGYLNVIDDLQPDALSLRRDLRETRERVLQQAVKRLSAAPFADQHKGESKFGDTLTAKIVQYLFQNLSEDIRIIEREKLEGIEKERGLSKDSEALLAVDYLVEGNILEAKVDSSEREMNQRKRVTTGVETIANPEWDRWNSMDDDERERANLETQPPRTIERQRIEDIQIATTYHRKVGVFSVSYRVIEAASAKVVFADTQRTKRELEDSDADGIELGDFKQEAKLAELPSDVEILDSLAEEVSASIGAKLAEVFVNPEVRYASDAERYVREGNYVDASQQYAYAIVLSDRKERDPGPWKTSLRSTVVAAGID